MITMSHIVNFWVIDQIFDQDCKEQVSNMSKMLYVNCLMKHFRNRPAKVTHATAFNIDKTEFGNYNKYANLFEELSRAGLVMVLGEYVTFNNMWGKYIDRTQLEKVSTFEYVAGYNFSGVENFENELQTNELFHEMIQLKYPELQMSDLPKLVNLFIKEQKSFDKKYNGWSDCSKHFTYWLSHNLNKAKDSFVPKISKVVSKNKILGQ